MCFSAGRFWVLGGRGYSICTCGGCCVGRGCWVEWCLGLYV